MSYYRDLWIGTGQQGPGKNRRTDQPWEPWLSEAISVWTLSTRDSGWGWKTWSVPGAELAVLGEFYEPVDGERLGLEALDYARENRADFRDPAGHYLLVLYDRERREISVFTNRHGTQHIYYEQGPRPRLSTQFLSLAADSPSRLDWNAIMGFLSLGYFPRESTFLSQVQILGPARLYRFDRHLNLIRVRRYWDWFYSPAYSSPSTALEAFDATMKDVVRGGCQGKEVVLPLSGGLDSRTLAGLVRGGEAKARKLEAYSYGYYRRSPEIRIGRALARIAGFPFREFVIEGYVWENMDRVMRSTEGFQSVDGTRQVAIHDYLGSAGEAVLCGHWGDLWMDTMNLDAYASIEEAWEKKLIKKGAQWFWDHAPRESGFRPKEELLEQFRQYRLQYEPLKSPDLSLMIYKTEEWSFRWTLASIRTYQEGIYPLLPFYDRRVSELFLRMPREWQKGRQFQLSYLKAFHEDLSRVVWQEYGRDLYHYQGWNNRNLLYRIGSRLWRMSQRKGWVQRNWELHYLSKEGRKNLEARLFQGPVVEYFSPRSIRELMEGFYRKPTAANGYTLSMLHTLAQSLERIVGK